MIENSSRAAAVEAKGKVSIASLNPPPPPRKNKNNNPQYDNLADKIVCYE